MKDDKVQDQQYLLERPARYQREDATILAPSNIRDMTKGDLS